MPQNNTSTTRWIGLDIFRLLAALGVVTNHYTGIFSGSPFYFFSIGMFFLLSGAGVEIGRNKAFGLSYFLSRIARLYPAYIIAVAMFSVTVVFSRGGGIPSGFTRTLVEHALFLLPATSREQLSSLNAGFWVLPIFIEFYILVSLFGRRIRPGYLFFIGVVFVITIKTLWSGPEDFVWLRYNLPSFLYAFALGMIITRFWKNHPDWKFPISPKTTFFIFFTALISLGSIFLFFEESQLEQITGWKFYHELCILLQSGSLISILYWNPSPGPRFKNTIISLSAITWPVYLVHLLPPIWISGSLPAAIALPLSVFMTLLMAYLIYRFIDIPALQISRRIRQSAAAFKT